MCVSAVWSIRLLGVWALNFFRWLGCWPLPGLGLGAAPLCSLCTSRPGGCLRLWCSCYLRRMLAGWACAGDALPCGLLVLRPLGLRVRLFLLAVYCIGGGVVGSCVAARLCGGVAPALCRAPSRQKKEAPALRLCLCGA